MAPYGKRGTLALNSTAYAVLLLAAAVMLSCEQSSSQELEIRDKPLREKFVEHLQQPDAWQSEPLSAGGRLKPMRRLRQLSYSSLKSYYRRAIREFENSYPADVFSPDIKTALSPYSGKLELVVPEVHKVPFMPLSPLAYEESSLAFKKITAEFDGKTIYGLYASARIGELYKNLPSGDKVDELYLPDVNARALGFTHAQLILPLSRNVRAAEVFEYNGFRTWETHQRYGKTDQHEKPIGLTNYAHQTGRLYAISAHPDFALSLPNAITRGSQLTFFLWKKGAADGSLPDFIFRFEYLPE